MHFSTHTPTSPHKVAQKIKVCSSRYKASGVYEKVVKTADSGPAIKAIMCPQLGLKYRKAAPTCPPVQTTYEMWFIFSSDIPKSGNGRIQWIPVQCPKT